MEFKKEEFMAEIKEVIEKEGKEHLLEFAEDIAFLMWKGVKVLPKHVTGLEFLAMLFTAADPTVTNMLDGIDKKDDK